MTPENEGYSVRIASKFDDFDHIAIKDFESLQDARNKRESMMARSEGRILEHRLVVL